MGTQVNSPHSVPKMLKHSYALEQEGKISEALQIANQALELAQQEKDNEHIAAALVCLAYHQQHLGHYPEARTLAEKALQTAKDLSKNRADALLILGNCSHEAGDLAEAEEHYLDSIELSRQIGYTAALSKSLHNLAACIYIPRGRFAIALAADNEALALQEDEESSWFSLATTGWVYWVTGKREKALQVLARMREVVHPGSLAEGYYFALAGDLAQDSDNPSEALTYYQQARTIDERLGDPALNAELRVGLSRYYRQNNVMSTAYSWADDALAIAHRSGNTDIQGWALIERGRASWGLGNLESAAEDFTAAIDLLLPMQANFDLARAHLLLAALARERGTEAEEQHWLEAASRIISGGYEFLLEQERELVFPILAEFINHPDPQIANLSNRLLHRLSKLPPPPLTVHGLGVFEVKQGKRTIPKSAWRARKAGQLFRLLLLARPTPEHGGKRYSLLREQVIEGLWRDKPPDSANGLFHRATSALRHVLEPDLPDKFPSRYLHVSGGGIFLWLPSGSWVDFEAFEEHFRNGNWSAALALYRGDLFPEDRYLDFAIARHERLHQDAVTAAINLARHALTAKDFNKALEACQLALDWEPWQEEAVLLGMQASTALNNRTRAIRMYQRLAQTLHDELGIEPQQSLQDYYQTLI